MPRLNDERSNLRFIYLYIYFIFGVCNRVFGATCVPQDRPKIKIQIHGVWTIQYAEYLAITEGPVLPQTHVNVFLPMMMENTAIMSNAHTNTPVSLEAAHRQAVVTV
ncbi:uncharacterized protein LOC128241279 [Mya arenaria]|uniref:uncharacterized protein LOC128241279 n=1 Tax=Mya arenaria TaxID=6604 RepID=UPI0022E0252D|nr:uncharacterized protein LOC128241279 [Mya arenaria]